MNEYAKTLLWNRFKDRQLGGWKFRKEVKMRGTTVDFYCPAHKLIVQVGQIDAEFYRPWQAGQYRHSTTPLGKFVIVEVSPDAVEDSLDLVIEQVKKKLGMVTTRGAI